MDTRAKIIAPEALWNAALTRQWTVIAGRFDPLTRTQAERIRSLSRSDRKLAVIIEPYTDSLLHAEARAVLIAALRYVDAVAISSAWPETVPVLRDADQDRSSTQEFVQLVRDRQLGVAR